MINKPDYITPVLVSLTLKASLHVSYTLSAYFGSGISFPSSWIL